MKKEQKFLSIKILSGFLAVFFVGYAAGHNFGLNLPIARAQKDRAGIELPDFSPLVAKLNPSVVFLVVKTEEEEFNDEIPENHPEVPPDSQKGVGSGFIIDRQGYILTNDHVVEGSENIEVVVGKSKYTAKVVGRDPQLDVALVKISTKRRLKPMTLGNSEKVKAGQWALAMGNPYGLENNVTLGVISGKGREIAEAPFVDLIQTDAAIYPGNSGGPLVDLDGRAIGINTAVVPGTQLGFSVPINKVKEILPQLRRGRVTRGYIGIEMAPVAPKLPDSATENGGVLVTKVRKGGPAKEAGLKKNDIIVEYDGNEIMTPNDLAKMVLRTKPGSRIDVKVERGDKEMSFTVTVSKAPKPVAPGSDKPQE